uniref:Putative HD domain-containing protein n=1 Tax=viral metagenome TaxID=1070528 RepID=A0A6M3ITL5_9ZZZZ
MIFDDKFMNPLFDLLESTRGVEQDIKRHPEIYVFEHSLQVLKQAFRESVDTDLILAAMLHDIGKKENSKGHEKVAVEWLNGLVSVKTLWLIEHHMRIWSLILGKMKKLGKVLELSGHPWIPELLLLARWDKSGRDPNMKVNYDRGEIMGRLNMCVEKRFG